MNKLFQLVPAIGVACLVFVPAGRAQPGTTDLTFDPGSATDGPIYAIGQQSDGKIIIGGAFRVVHREVRCGIARLNADGTVDTTFGTSAGGTDGPVYSLAIQTNGKLVIGGAFTNVNGLAHTNIARLNTDGSVDVGFAASVSTSSPMDAAVYALAIQSDGKVLIGGEFQCVNGKWGPENLARLNNDGSLDSSWDSSTRFDEPVYAVAIQSDGKVLAAGSFTCVNGLARYRIARFDSDGSLDAHFSAAVSGEDFYGGVRCIAIQPDGKVLIGGDFTNVNDLPRNGIARLETDGSLDPDFFAEVYGEEYNWGVYSIGIQSDGTLLIGGAFTNVNWVARTNIVRLNDDGSLDAGFAASVSADWFIIWYCTVYSLAIQRDGKVLLGGDFEYINGQERNFLARLNANGSLDANFVGDVRSGINNWALPLAVQTDGKVLVGGHFTSINSLPYHCIARLNTDGSLDTNFVPAVCGNKYPFSEVIAVAIRNDGKVLIGGHFTNVNGVARTNIARLNSNGSLDSSFAAAACGRESEHVFSGVACIAVESNGKVLIGGAFTNVNGVAQTNIARLNSNGSVDSSFVAAAYGQTFEFPLGGVACVAVQSDGKVLIGGAFTNVNGVARTNIARLHADGTVDTGFVAAASASRHPIPVFSVAVQTDGKVLIGGEFTDVNGWPRNYIARLNVDGSLDTSFVAEVLGPEDYGAVYSIAIQSDGKVLIGGNFTNVYGLGRTNVARLNSDGSVDAGFAAALYGDLEDYSCAVHSTAIQSDGKVLVAGDFSVANNVARRNVARLLGSGAGGCSYAISPNSWTAPGSGGITNVNITTTSGCSWSVYNPCAWWVSTSPTDGIGSGTVTVALPANCSSSTRTLTLGIAGQSFIITQPPSGNSFWYECFDKSSVAMVSNYGTVQGDTSHWKVFYGTGANRQSAEVTPSHALRLSAWEGGMVSVLGYIVTSGGCGIVLRPGLRFGFFVSCLSAWDSQPLTKGGMMIHVDAYNPSSGHGVPIYYVLDHESGFISPLPGRVAFLGSSGNYECSLWQDFSTAVGGDPTGYVLGDIELFLYTDYDMDGVVEKIEATFDNFWIGEEAPFGPQLKITRAGPASVAICWPPNWSGYSLQETTNLISAAWTNVAQQPSNDGTNWSVAVPATNAQRFYRLMQP